MESNKSRLKTLYRIERYAYMARGGLSLVRGRCMLGASGGGLLAFLINSVIFKSGFLLPAGLMLGAVAGYLWAGRKQYFTLVYEQLADYQPVNADSYKWLQKQAAEGGLKAQDVLDWVWMEIDILKTPKKKPASEIATDQARLRFARQPGGDCSSTPAAHEVPRVVER